MRKKIETRKKFGRICALVVVGMFVAMTSMSTSANDPFDWTTSGNFGTRTEVLGTLNDDDLRIITNGMQRMVVTSSGKVGIGTIDPICALHVKDPTPTPPFIGTTIAIESSYDPIIPGDDLGKIVFMGPWIAGEPSIGAMIRAQARGSFGSTQPNESPTGLLFYTQDANSGVNALLEPRMVIAENGNVGINTTNPQYPLEVHGEEIWFDCDYIKLGSNTYRQCPNKHSVVSEENYRIIIDDEDEATDYYFAVGAHELHNEPAWTTNELFWIRENGNVGIGVKSPLGRLWTQSTSYTGTGTITSLGTDVTGSGTSFTTELMVGSEIWIDIYKGPKPDDYQREIKRVTAITSDTDLDIDSAFDPDLTTATSFNYTRPILCVATNEKVGISTISPTEKLDVNGRARIRDLPIDNNLPYVVVANSTGVLHRRDAGTIGVDADWYDVGNPGYPPDNIDDNIYTYGNVGIATLNPTQKLHVNGSVRIENAIYDNNNDPGTSGQILQTTGSGIEWVDPPSVSDDDWDYTTYPPHMFSLPTGNVGIGTANPMEKLDVEGNIHASGSLKSGNSIEIVGGGINKNTIYYENDDHGLLTDWNLFFKGGSESSHGESYVLFQNGLFERDKGVAITMNETRGHNKFWLSAYDEKYGNLIYTEDPSDGSGQGFGIAGGSHMDPFDRFVVNSDEMFLGYCNKPGDGSGDSGGDGTGNLYVRSNVGIGTVSPTGKLDVNGNDIRIRSSQTPASASASGYTGEIAWDSNYIYVCTNGDGPGGSEDTWKRAAISTW